MHAGVAGRGCRTTLKVTDAPQRAWGGRTWEGTAPHCLVRRPLGSAGNGERGSGGGGHSRACVWRWVVVLPKEPLAPGRSLHAALRQPGWPAGLEDWSVTDLPRGLGSEHAPRLPSSSGIGTHTVHTPGTHRAVMGTSRSPGLGLSVRRERRFDMT